MAASIIKGGGQGGIGGKRLRKNAIYLSQSRKGGIASVEPYQFGLVGLVDNTAFTFATVIVPNAKVGAILHLRVGVALGDGDSSEASLWTIAISRIVGAAAIIAISAKTGAANTAGAAGNAQTTISNVAVVGAVTAINSFALQIKCARSAGAADGHFALIDLTILNMLAGGAFI